MKALIVEPSRLVSMMLGNVMRQHGVEPIATRTAEDALAKLASEKFDLLCFAYVLGDTDGIAFISKARQRGLVGDRPAIMFSGTHDKDHVDQALRAGVTECFSKHQLGELEGFIARFAASRGRQMAGRALLVEDSATAAAFCRKVLGNMGLVVDECRSAEEALDKFATNIYDVVLTDYLLSGTATGLAVVRAIRDTPGRKAQTPILVMSALDDTARRIEILRNGANDFVNKPVLAEELEVRVFNLVTLRHLMHRLEVQHEVMRDMALHDQLTSLYNRNYLQERLPSLIAKARGLRRPLAIAVIDIDHFKKINDTHGHAVGDIVLARVAEAMQEKQGHRTLLARFGGEEFVAVMLETPLDGAAGQAEQLRGHIALLKPNGLAVTVSIGVSELEPDESFDGLFRRADAAVYRAKEN
jgi:diguanylate cyclase (GGDEF)-like protein